MSVRPSVVFLYYKYAKLDMFSRVHIRLPSGLAHNNM